MTPPLFAAPVPLTVRLPEAPVLLRMMPLAGPLAGVPTLIDWNFRPDAPMVVLTTFNAMPAVVVASVLVVADEETVPAPVAVKASFVPVLRVMAPLKLIVAPVLLLRKMPVPVPPAESVIA